ncbi:hypothetical protein K402DRAFT_19621 [Aulographum hederae CBS 113979]|uniref:Uncharacterized protein n=1 Tax=Aulographum hederae CBS 113979 TaxID=1176131 RepID=A0A6G1H6U6_9PEZI|nr:hypothetical protein K402DRAFT_19621 [Aulographum hederae CBS 113979]
MVSMPPVFLTAVQRGRDAALFVTASDGTQYQLLCIIGEDILYFKRKDTNKNINIRRNQHSTMEWIPFLLLTVVQARNDAALYLVGRDGTLHQFIRLVGEDFVTRLSVNGSQPHQIHFTYHRLQMFNAGSDDEIPISQRGPPIEEWKELQALEDAVPPREAASTDQPQSPEAVEQGSKRPRATGPIIITLTDTRGETNIQIVVGGGQASSLGVRGTASSTTKPVRAA